MALLFEDNISISYPTASFTPVVERFQTDSYSVRASRGINSQEEIWNIVWTNLSKANVNDLRAALKAASVEVLWWQSPLENNEKPYTCTEYSVSPYPSATTRFSVSATLHREYDPT